MVDDREEDHQLESINRAHKKKSSLFGDHAGKLWIKLRVPKDEEAEAEGDEEEQKKLEKKENSQQQKSDVVITRICQVCNKGFKSGKALGGHMRVHFQTNKDLIFTKKLSKQSQPIIKFKKQNPERSDFAETKSPPPPSGGDEVYTCSECGKIFPSAKSLFGHMRCHPDREWRGIRPPSPQPVKASPFSSVSDANQLDDYEEEEDDDDKVDSAGGGGDLAKLLGGWSVRAKRGRKAILGDLAAEDEDEDMRDAVFHLMSLANGGFCEANKKKERVSYEEFEATNSNSHAWKNGSEEVRSKRMVHNDESMKNKKKKKRKDREIAGGYMKDHPVKELRKTDDGSIDVIHVGNVKAVQETDFLAGKLNWPKEYAEKKDVNDVDDDDSDDSEKTQVVNHNQNHHYSADSSNGKLMKMMKKRKKMKLRDLDDPSSRITHQDPEKFKCTTCDKCFSTHQALGGHRSSHNKFKMVIHNALHEDLDHLEDENLMEESVDEGAGSSKLGDDPHLCKICNKRCRPMTGGTCGGDQAISRSQSGRRVVMEFDLNEEPPVDEDGMESSDHPPRAASASASASYGSSNNNNNNSVEFPFF